MATIFSLPAVYATAFGFIYGYGKILQSMAASKLLPSAFEMTLGFETSAMDSPFNNNFAVMFHFSR